jgi:hypothetical protein
MIIEFFWLILLHVLEMLLRHEAIRIRHAGWIVVSLWFQHVLAHGHLLLECILMLVIMVYLRRVRDERRRAAILQILCALLCLQWLTFPLHLLRLNSSLQIILSPFHILLCYQAIIDASLHQPLIRVPTRQVFLHLFLCSRYLVVWHDVFVHGSSHLFAHGC